MSYADGLLATGERIIHREKQHPFVFVWGARWTILAVIIASTVIVLTQDSDVPDVLVAIGTGAIGALAGLLAPVPSR